MMDKSDLKPYSWSCLRNFPWWRRGVFGFAVRAHTHTHCLSPPLSSIVQVSLILVDQEHRKHIVQTFKPTPESSSFKRPTTDMNVASGTVECSHTYYIQCCTRNVHVFLFLTPLPLPLSVTIDTYMSIVYVELRQ